MNYIKGNYLFPLTVHFLMFLASFSLFAQHVSDLTEPIIRSTTVVYAARKPPSPVKNQPV
jgi:hypothetical protein